MFGMTCLFINNNIKTMRNDLENHIGSHTWRVYVITAACMPE